MEERRKSNLNGRKIIAVFFEGLIAMTVLLFLGLHTFNFFTYAFSAENWYYGFLGFGLTSIGFVGYLLAFKWASDTPLKRVIALIMMIVCILGELLAAGFGMQIETWKKQGWQLAEGDFKIMLLAVQVLAGVHALALTGIVAGDEILRLLSKDDEELEKPRKVANTPSNTSPVGLPTLQLHADTEETVLAGKNGKGSNKANPTRGE